MQKEIGLRLLFEFSGHLIGYSVDELAVRVGKETISAWRQVSLPDQLAEEREWREVHITHGCHDVQQTGETFGLRFQQVFVTCFCLIGAIRATCEKVPQIVRQYPRPIIVSE